MDSDRPLFVRRRELAELLLTLEAQDSRGVVVLGAPGSGKTSMLQMARQELDQRGQATFFVPLRGLDDPRELGSRVLDTVQASGFAKSKDLSRIVRSSAGGIPFDEAVRALGIAGSKLGTPVLLLDGLDEARLPHQIERAVGELSRWLEDWRFVVSSRSSAFGRSRTFENFQVIELQDLTQQEAGDLIASIAPEVEPDILAAAAAASQGSPLFLLLIAEQLRSSRPIDLRAGASLSTVLESFLARVIEKSAQPARLRMLLEHLALAGGEELLGTLAERAGIPVEDGRLLLEDAHALITYTTGGRISLFHESVREVILSTNLLARPIKIAELRFGSEEAEKDDLLEQCYVPRFDLRRILEDERSIVLGHRGAGKSAIFRTLAGVAGDGEGNSSVIVLPVAESAPLLHQIVDTKAAPAAEEYRAAWLVVVATVVASAIPDGAPKTLRRTATDLRAAFGFSAKKEVIAKQIFRWVGRQLAGSTLKFAVGPVNLEAKLPAGGRSLGGATIDIEGFLHDCDRYLSSAERRVVVMFDRIDEMFKYDRSKQEPLVQALLQAEARVSLLESIGLVVFIRTDLFELYDIQEKNKLVSRTVALNWSEEDWLQLLVNRVFANPSLEQLASALRAERDSMDLRASLEALFPDTIEGQPIEPWLVESVRNGNGNISPRLVVMLLYLARDMELSPDAAVSTLPLFSEHAVSDAMTRLSDLCYSEVVDDFKVARSFVLNCRAGKLVEFALSEVEGLFDTCEGPVSEQVRMLERLGFLERVVVQNEGETKSLFRIPKLYTRCWDYA